MALCTGYWDRDVFLGAADAVTAGGMLGGEAFTARINNWGAAAEMYQAIGCMSPNGTTDNE